jgi:hypothetical protein
MQKVAQRALVGAISDRTAKTRRGSTAKIATRIGFAGKPLTGQLLSADRAQRAPKRTDLSQAVSADWELGNIC